MLGGKWLSLLPVPTFIVSGAPSKTSLENKDVFEVGPFSRQDKTGHRPVICHYLPASMLYPQLTLGLVRFPCRPMRENKDEQSNQYEQRGGRTIAAQR